MTPRRSVCNLFCCSPPPLFPVNFLRKATLMVSFPFPPFSLACLAALGAGVSRTDKSRSYVYSHGVFLPSELGHLLACTIIRSLPFSLFFLFFFFFSFCRTWDMAWVSQSMVPRTRQGGTVARVRSRHSPLSPGAVASSATLSKEGASMRFGRFLVPCPGDWGLGTGDEDEDGAGAEGVVCTITRGCRDAARCCV